LPIGLLPADQAIRDRFSLFGLTTMGPLAELPRSARRQSPIRRL
jgi:hypothetical protein